MTAAHFLLDELPPGDRLELTGDEGRHAARVRRLGVGESLTVGDGRGTIADCLVAAVTPGGLSVSVLARRVVPAPSPRLIVVQALAKGERGELAVETMTELGVDEIVPWAAERAIVRWDGPRGDKALERWRRTAREAVKQSRRAWLPTIAPLARTADLTPTFMLHEDASAPLSAVELPAGDLTLVVGPEGGIGEAEQARLVAAGARAVRLGPEVLRTSTAGPAALAALSLRLGRWV